MASGVIERFVDRWRYPLVFVFTIIGDYVATWGNYAIATRNVTNAVISTSLMPFISLLSIVIFFEEKTLSGRFRLAVVYAIASAIGTLLMFYTVSK